MFLLRDPVAYIWQVILTERDLVRVLDASKFSYQDTKLNSCDFLDLCIVGASGLQI